MYIYIYTYSWSYPHYFVSLVVSQHILFLSSYQLFLIIISHSTHPSSWNCGIPNHQVLIGWSALDPVFKMVDGYHWRLIRVFMIMLGLQSLLYPKFVPLKLFICTPKLFPPQIHHLSFHGYIWSIACLLYLYIYIWSTTCLIYTYICTLYIYVHEYVYAYSSCHLIFMWYLDAWSIIMCVKHRYIWHIFNRYAILDSYTQWVQCTWSDSFTQSESCSYLELESHTTSIMIKSHT